METRRQGATLFLAIVVLIATLVIIQLWLVAAAVEAWLAREVTILWPAAIASIVLFLINGGLLLYVLAFDRRLRQAGSHD